MPRTSTRQKLVDQRFSELDTVLEYVSSDDEDTIEESFNMVLEDCLVIYNRPVLPVPKGSDCLVHLLPRYDDERFKQELRVSRNKFDLILQLIKDDPVFHTEKELQQFPVHIQLALALYRFGHNGTGTSIYSVARQFSMGDGSTVCRVTDRVITAILNLSKEFIRWPTANERKVEFRDSTFSGCVGLIDGTEIPLEEKPIDDPESYFNRKKQYAIQLQGIVGFNKRFLNIFVKYPGSVHDARIFAESHFGQATNEYLVAGEYILGDSAYKNTNQVVVPFRSNSTFGSARRRRKFNYELSKQRVYVEHAFGMLKEKFCSLKSLRIRVDRNAGHLRACHWIAACCTLYNIIFDDITENEWASLDPRELEEFDSETNNQRYNESNEQREKLYKFINQC